MKLHELNLNNTHNYRTKNHCSIELYEKFIKIKKRENITVEITEDNELMLKTEKNAGKINNIPAFKQWLKQNCEK